MIARIRSRGLPVVLISHNVPRVFEIADRIHGFGRRATVASPQDVSMAQVVGLIPGALPRREDGEIVEVVAAGLR